MLGDAFRLWGAADWLLPKVHVGKWTLIGCISTEQRCLSVIAHLEPHALLLDAAKFLEIEDLPSDLSSACAERRQQNREVFDQTTGLLGSVHKFGLLDSPILIKQFVADVVSAGATNVLVDLTSLPKRFFFPMVKLLLRAPSVTNLVATYSTPASYLDPNQQLAFEPGDWSFLPMFQREEAPPTLRCKRVVVGVGFLPLRLPELLKQDYEDAELVLLLPFPPGSPQAQRNWLFVHEIEKMCPLESDQQIVRVHAMDTSGCFDHLCQIGGHEPQRTVFAPFGPKPHSLAMCLYAEKNNCEVYYTQPKHYHPEYTSGQKMVNGKPETFAYVLKLNGTRIY